MNSTLLKLIWLPLVWKPNVLWVWEFDSLQICLLIGIREVACISHVLISC